jgi:hypothetical protein
MQGGQKGSGRNGEFARDSRCHVAVWSETTIASKPKAMGVPSNREIAVWNNPHPAWFECWTPVSRCSLDGEKRQQRPYYCLKSEDRAYDFSQFCGKKCEHSTAEPAAP